MASRLGADFSHRTTGRRPATFPHHGTDQGCDRSQLDTLGVHARQQGFARGVDEIHLAEIQDGFSAMGGVTGGPPALLQFVDPRPGQPALEFEPKLAGTVMKRDFQHGRSLIYMASPMPECETMTNQDVAGRSGSAMRWRLPKYRQIRRRARRQDAVPALHWYLASPSASPARLAVALSGCRGAGGLRS